MVLILEVKNINKGHVLHVSSIERYTEPAPRFRVVNMADTTLTLI